MSTRVAHQQTPSPAQVRQAKLALETLQKVGFEPVQTLAPGGAHKAVERLHRAADTALARLDNRMLKFALPFIAPTATILTYFSLSIKEVVTFLQKAVVDKKGIMLSADTPITWVPDIRGGVFTGRFNRPMEVARGMDVAPQEELERQAVQIQPGGPSPTSSIPIRTIQEIEFDGKLNLFLHKLPAQGEQPSSELPPIAIVTHPDPHKLFNVPDAGSPLIGHTAEGNQLIFAKPGEVVHFQIVRTPYGESLVGTELVGELPEGWHARKVELLISDERHTIDELRFVDEPKTHNAWVIERPILVILAALLALATLSLYALRRHQLKGLKNFANSPGARAALLHAARSAPSSSAALRQASNSVAKPLKTLRIEHGEHIIWLCMKDAHHESLLAEKKRLEDALALAKEVKRARDAHAKAGLERKLEDAGFRRETKANQIETQLHIVERQTTNFPDEVERRRSEAIRLGKEIRRREELLRTLRQIPSAK